MDLPALRRGLDLRPSPVEEQPGLMIRDPFQYTESVIVIPPPLVGFVAFFDGERSLEDLKVALVTAAGDVRAADFALTLQKTLSEQGFLEDDAFVARKEAKEGAFRSDPVCQASHAGSAYPRDKDPLSATMNGYLQSVEHAAPVSGLVGIAAPHVSPEGGPSSYAAAYHQIGPSLRERTFAILGTSHYGTPGKFGLTRKPFRTPFGEARTDEESVSALADSAPRGILLDDYCFAIEHSIEFQVVFLQHLLGSDITILPILCGPLFPEGGALPEDDRGVADFLAAFKGLSERLGERLFFVLGVDFAHMGRRYGDDFSASARAGEMEGIQEQDRARLRSIEEGDAGAFWRQLGEDGDSLKWCGSSPLYTFLRTRPDVRGTLLAYEQWNIDPSSVVSFGALAFFRPGLQ
jgi:AmmeMemoRadiSam system protein B